MPVAAPEFDRPVTGRPAAAPPSRVPSGPSR
jgi:hypothetical protein